MFGAGEGTPRERWEIFGPRLLFWTLGKREKERKENIWYRRKRGRMVRRRRTIILRRGNFCRQDRKTHVTNFRISLLPPKLQRRGLVF